MTEIHTPDTPTYISNLERVFHFRNPDFRRYMRMKTDKQNIVALLFKLHDAMRPSQLSLVQYASGWAAAEVSITQKDVGSYLRYQGLEAACKQWAIAAASFSNDRKQTTDPKRHAQLWMLELQAIHALAYRPMFEMGIETFLNSDNAYKPEFVSAKRQENIHNVMALAEIIEGLLPTASSAERPPMLGFLYELAVGALLQRDSLEKFIILPASLRQDHHKFRGMRSDLLAYTRHKRPRKYWLQVKSAIEDVDPDEKRIFISAKHDLTAGIIARPLDCVRALIKDHKGQATPEESATLDVIGRALTLRPLQNKEVKPSAKPKVASQPPADFE